MGQPKIESHWKNEDSPIFCGGLDKGEALGLLYNALCILSLLANSRAMSSSTEQDEKHDYGLYLVLSGLENTVEKALSILQNEKNHQF